MYPMKMTPAYKDYLWGGQRLPLEYGKNTDMKPVAESWEFSIHPDGSSVVANGKFSGQTLKEVLGAHPSFLGKDKEFPVLIKFIDALDNLSLQVHPDDDYAKRVEGQNGKNEMWYVVDAKPDAKLIIGLRKELSKKEITQQITEGTFLGSVNIVPVKKGDSFEIPAGLLHAIGEGTLIYEVQQNSNVTYRVYDYQRKNPDGSLRELHVDKAVDVINSGLRSENRGGEKPVVKEGYTKTKLTQWQWFNADKLTITDRAELKVTSDSYETLTVIEGELSLQFGEENYPLRKGESVFLPAGLGGYAISGRGEVIVTGR